MTIYKPREVRKELLFKLEEFEPRTEFSDDCGWSGKVHSDIYYKLCHIIENNQKDLMYIRDILLQAMNRPMNEYDHELCNLRLKVLECRLKGERLNTCQHDYIGMKHLPEFGCKCEDIVNLTGRRDGTPDFYATSLFGNEWEIKVITGNIIIVTRDQLRHFKKDVNILIFKTINYRSYINTITNVGCKFHNHIKFSDMCDVILEKKSYFQHKRGGKLLDNIPIVYHIHVSNPMEGETAKSILEDRYKRESELVRRGFHI